MANTKNTIILSALSLVALASCAGPESYYDKMSRYSPKVSGTNHVPEIKTTGFEFTKSKTLRAPASANGAVALEQLNIEESALSNKKLYFLTLFGQYESMKKHAQTFDAPSVNICPHFHSSLLEHKGRKPAHVRSETTQKQNKKFEYDKKEFDSRDYVAKRPELSLPLSKEEVSPKVIDLFRSQKDKLSEFQMNEIIHQAIDIHLTKTYSEIRELCEYGVSSNYYIYENLITHIKNSNFAPVDKNMDTLLKTTIFSNMALVTSLDKDRPTPMRSIASIEPKNKKPSSTYTDEVMTRLNVEWANEYFDSLKTSK